MFECAFSVRCFLALFDALVCAYMPVKGERHVATAAFKTLVTDSVTSVTNSL